MIPTASASHPEQTVKIVNELFLRRLQPMQVVVGQVDHPQIVRWRNRAMITYREFSLSLSICEFVRIVIKRQDCGRPIKAPGQEWPQQLNVIAGSVAKEGD
jgi:hypothetical protein